MGYSKYGTPRLKADGYRAKRENVVPHIKEITKEYLRGPDGKPFILADFHVELLELMFEGGKYIVNWPTDHAKSEMSSFIFPILSLIEDPDESHLICGANINDSKSRVQKIERELEDNERLVRDFPWVAKPKERSSIWSATQFNVAGRTVNNRNPSVLAVSTSAQDIRGRRGKLIMDDIEGLKHRGSATEREKLLRFVQMEAWRCFEDTHESARPLLIAVGTPFDPDSIYFDLERLHGWVSRRFSAYVSEYATKMDANGDDVTEYRPVYTWPRKAQKVEEARRDMVHEQFAIQYRMDPTGGDSTKLSAQQIVEMLKNGTFEEDQVRTYVSLDPASGSRHRKADYAGISVVRLAWKQGEDLPMVDIVECYNFKQGLFEQVRLCAELATKHGCPVIYEANSQQGYTYPDTFNHLSGLGHIQRVDLVRHYTTEGSKFDQKTGLTVIPTLLKSGRLRVPESQVDSVGVSALIKEIRDLGQTGSHDHLMASIWFAYKKTFDEVKLWAAPTVKNTYTPFFTPYTRVGKLRQPARYR